MATIKANALATLREAQAAATGLVDAANGDPSRCCVFDPIIGMRCEPFTQEQRDAVRRYVDTWIVSRLEAAISSIDGNRSWQNESYLDTSARGL